MPNSALEERVAAAKAKRDKIAGKLAQVHARQRNLEAQITAINGKQSTRRKILVGNAILAEVRDRIAKDTKDPLAHEIAKIIARRLTKPADFELVFGRRREASTAPLKPEGEAAS